MRVTGGALLLSAAGFMITAYVSVGASAASGSQASAPSLPSQRAVLDEFCVSCHNERLRTAGLSLDTADVDHPADDGCESPMPDWRRL